MNTLYVGTIEPRKGVSQLLDAADILWSDQDVVFVLVGKGGWKVDQLILRIRQHAELGKRLFWFEGVSDELLGRLYGRATAVVMPTEGEGFGLPLVEAARHGTPIIARDLKVLREVADQRGVAAGVGKGDKGSELHYEILLFTGGTAAVLTSRRNPELP